MAAVALDTRLGCLEPGPAAPHHAARSMKSLWDQLVAIIPYSDYLAWFLQQEKQQKWLLNKNFDMTYLFVCTQNCPSLLPYLVIP